jgi:hypothetical protein
MKNDYFIGISNPPQWFIDKNRNRHFRRLKRIEKVLLKLRARPFSAINGSRILSLLESAKLMIHRMEMKSVRIQLARKVVLPRIRESYPDIEQFSKSERARLINGVENLYHTEGLEGMTTERIQRLKRLSDELIWNDRKFNPGSQD